MGSPPFNLYPSKYGMYYDFNYSCEEFHWLLPFQRSITKQGNFAQRERKLIWIFPYFSHFEIVTENGNGSSATIKTSWAIRLTSFPHPRQYSNAVLFLFTEHSFHFGYIYVHTYIFFTFKTWIIFSFGRGKWNLIRGFTVLTKSCAISSKLIYPHQNRNLKAEANLFYFSFFKGSFTSVGHTKKVV